MSQKRSFPDDWSNLTDAEVQKNLSYILRHFKQYSVVKKEMDKYLIGDNVIIDIEWKQFFNKFVMDNYIVNNRRIPLENKKATRLYNKCCDISDISRDFKSFAVFFGVMLAIGILTFKITFNKHKQEKKAEKTKKQIEAAIKQYEENLPNYQEYLETKQKIINFRDSLERACK